MQIVFFQRPIESLSSIQLYYLRCHLSNATHSFCSLIIIIIAIINIHTYANKQSSSIHALLKRYRRPTTFYTNVWVVAIASASGTVLTLESCIVEKA